MPILTSVAELEALYGLPAETARVKVTDRVTPHYRAFIEASPFVALATSGPEGLDCSPRGDRPGFVRVHDERTLMIPDRKGNNRTDSLRNIIRDPRCGLLFLVPGSGTTLRVNGRAGVDTDEALCAAFSVEGRTPRSVIVLSVEAVYFQCSRAVLRSELWNPERHVDPATLPTPGSILAALSDGEVGGDDYDRAWPRRARESMW
jgi:PPOX class probable FMN-dependent enzyme